MKEEMKGKGNSLLISFDMSNLSTVGTFALRAGGFPTASFARRIACRATERALLLLASKTTFLVAVETAEFGFETVEGLVRWCPGGRKDDGYLETYSRLLRASISGSPVG